jgi:hypothetical protein
MFKYKSEISCPLSNFKFSWFVVYESSYNVIYKYMYMRNTKEL